MGSSTVNTLRPRWDAARSVVGKKPQLGQGLFALESTTRELRRRGPAVPGRGRRTDADEKGRSSTRVDMGHDSGEAATTGERPAYDVWSQGGALRERAQLDQGHYGASTLGKLLRREAASLRWKWQTSACRSCDLAVSATPQAWGDGQRAWGTPTVVSKGRNAGRTPAFVETSLLGGRWESLARSLWYIPGSGKGPPGF